MPRPAGRERKGARGPRGAAAGQRGPPQLLAATSASPAPPGSRGWGKGGRRRLTLRASGSFPPRALPVRWAAAPGVAAAVGRERRRWEALGRQRREAPPPPQTAPQYGRPAAPRGKGGAAPRPPPPPAGRPASRRGLSANAAAAAAAVRAARAPPPALVAARRTRRRRGSPRGVGTREGRPPPGSPAGSPSWRDWAGGTRAVRAAGPPRPKLAVRPPPPLPTSGNLKLPLVPENSPRAFPSPPRRDSSSRRGSRTESGGVTWLLSWRILDQETEMGLF